MPEVRNSKVDRHQTTLESRLRLVIDTIPEQVWSALPDGSVDFLNQRWQEYTGLALDEGLGKGVRVAIHPEDLPLLIDEWDRSVVAGTTFEKEARIRRADGQYRWFLVRAVPLRDDFGAVVKWYGTNIDIEDRRQAEQIRTLQACQASMRADVSTAFSKAASLAGTLRECVEAMVRHLDAAFARIWMLNKEQQTLELRASAGMYTHLDGRHSRIPIGKQKIGLIAQEKTPHLTNDVVNDPRITDKNWAQTEGIVSFAGYPLMVEGRLIGVMAMFACNPLSADTLDTLASVADLIAQGIERKRTEEELRETQTQLRMRAEQALEETGLRLAAQSVALTELTATEGHGFVGFDGRLRAILESCARTLGVKRVSVWEFSEHRSVMRCVDLFESTPALHTSGVSLSRDRYPKYFAAVEQEQLIAAEDAHRDERTREFSGDYLLANGIGAMLDVPLSQCHVAVGVLCIEHVGGTRRWSTDERNFALSVSNLVAAASADEDRRIALHRLAESEKIARLVVDTAHDAFIGMGSDGRIVSWNAKAEATFGWSREEVIGRSLVDTIIPASLREAHQAGMRRFQESGEAPVVGRLIEVAALHRDGREFPVELTISKPITRADGFYFAAFLRDISKRRQREEELRQARNLAEARAKSLELLNDISRELSSFLNTDELLERIGELLYELLEYHTFSVLLLDSSTRMLKTRFSFSGSQVVEKPDIPIDRGLVGYAARHRQPVVVGDVHTDPRYIKFHEETRSELSVPLVTKDRLIGVLDIENTCPHYFSESHVQAVMILASQLAVALDNAILHDCIRAQEAELNQDLTLARELQKRLLPSDVPDMKNAVICTLSCAARIIAGDMIHFGYYRKHRAHVALLGDVSGKGAAAAIYGALTIGIIRSLADQELPPSEMLKAVNQALMEGAIDERYVALAYTLWDDVALTFRMANSGLPRPIRYRNGQIQLIEAVGTPLGMLAEVHCEEICVEALPGDVYLFLTDGIVEACNSREQEFGYPGLEAVLRNCDGASASELRDALTRALAAHCEGVEAQDDQTLLILKVAGEQKGGHLRVG